MYKPIENYGLIGNMHSAALVGMDGAIDWYCFPHFDSPSIFGCLLDERIGGCFRIAPVDDVPRTHQYYWPQTNVLVTRFLLADGSAEVTDYMPVANGGMTAKHWLIRHVTVTRGTLELCVRCEPAFNYARDKHTTTVNENGASFTSPNLKLELCSTIPLNVNDNGVSAQFTLKEGERAVFVLRAAETEGECARGVSEEQSQALLDATIKYWRNWLSSCTYRGRWREMVERSALVLKLLTFEPTGALVAAVTTSLPEQIGGVRNWDYRYTWLRDAAFCIYALIRVGFYHESIRFMDWISQRCREEPTAGSLGIMYTVNGRGPLDEVVLKHLEGYKKSSPVRVGNAAHEQLQLDIYGELMDSVYLHNKYSAPIGYDVWLYLQKIANYVCDNWRNPDHGLWEVRGEPQHFIYSKVMCWVALDRAIRLCDKRSFPGDTVRWLRERNSIYEEVMTKGWNSDRHAFVQSYGSNTIDASNLIMPLVFFMAPNDPRFLTTLDAIRTSTKDGGLSSGGLLYRYDNKYTKDGLTGQEGMFNMCTFWLVEALTRAGRMDRDRLEDARLLFERMLTYSNHLGLYAEQAGAEGEALGNYPQAITHLALISAAVNLDRALDNKLV